ncbi:hypothetical protein JK217_08800 [Gluconobacter kondonii]|uniref:hypothetical protein n=1 Tax=Gluconobacter kondonii TaxID=941463 RepID=UPI001B8BFE37|nr:hypothetical protein [Gluconobacter kondonii]MBS1077848.1 hypothetical protein [Gluconobacter kondonii]
MYVIHPIYFSSPVLKELRINEIYNSVLVKVSNGIPARLLPYPEAYTDIISDFTFLTQRIREAKHLDCAVQLYCASEIFWSQNPNPKLVRLMLKNIKNNNFIDSGSYIKNINSEFYKGAILSTSLLVIYSFLVFYLKKFGFYSFGTINLDRIFFGSLFGLIGSLVSWNIKAPFGYEIQENMKPSHVQWNIFQSLSFSFVGLLLGLVISVASYTDYFPIKIDHSPICSVSIVAFAIGLGGTFSKKFIKKIDSF